MKDVFLLIVTLAAFVFGYFVMKKVDDFIAENNRMVDAESRKNHCSIKIAAEAPALFDSTASALEQCSEMNPYIEFAFGSGRAIRLLEKLHSGSVDLVLLYEEHIDLLDKELLSIEIPYHSEKNTVTMLGLVAENMDNLCCCYVVWNPSIPSKNRDRVLFYLENEHCRLKCSYCDYLS